LGPGEGLTSDTSLTGGVLGCRGACGSIRVRSGEACCSTRVRGAVRTGARRRDGSRAASRPRTRRGFAGGSLRVGLAPGAPGQVPRDRLGDGLAQLTGITGECLGPDLREGVIVRQAEVGEDERPQLVVEPGLREAVAVEIVEAGEHGDVVPSEIAQRPILLRMLVADGFAAVGDAAT